jgi:hypothetical protein
MWTQIQSKKNERFPVRQPTMVARSMDDDNK